MKPLLAKSGGDAETFKLAVKGKLFESCPNGKRSRRPTKDNEPSSERKWLDTPIRQRASDRTGH
jgi:hypothetical protein